MTASNNELNRTQQLGIPAAEFIGGKSDAGERLGGEYTVDVSAGPLIAGMELTDTLRGDLMFIVEAGDSQQLGLVDLDPGSTDPAAEDRYAIVKLQGKDMYSEDFAGVEVQKNKEGLLRGAVIADATQEQVIGAKAKKLTPGLEDIASDGSDMAFSGKHFGIRVDAETGNVIVTDKNSKNGTSVISRKHEQADIEEDDDMTVAVDDEATVPSAEVHADKPEIQEVAEEVAELVVPLEVVVEPVAEDVAEEVEEAVEEDPGKLDISAFFESGEALSNALRDPEIDYKLKSELRNVVVSWQELQHSKLAEQLWTETVQPRLKNLEGIGLQEQARSLSALKSDVDAFSQTWNGLVNGIYRGNVEEVGDIVRRKKGTFGGEAVEQLKSKFQTLANDDTIARATRALGLDTEDADLMVRKLTRKIDGSIDPEDAETMVAELASTMKLTERKQLGESVQMLHDKIEFKGWKGIVRNIEELTFRAKKSGKNLGDSGITGSFGSIQQAISEFDQQRQRHGILDPAVAETGTYIVRMTQQVLEQLGDTNRLNRISAEVASWVGK